MESKSTDSPAGNLIVRCLCSARGLRVDEVPQQDSGNRKMHATAANAHDERDCRSACPSLSCTHARTQRQDEQEMVGGIYIRRTCKAVATYPRLGRGIRLSGNVEDAVLVRI